MSIFQNIIKVVLLNVILFINIQAADISQQEAFIERFYQNILGRSADTEGMNTWLSVIQNESATKVALGFFKSQEFINKDLSNEQFIDTLYQTLFDREADLEGKTGWLNQLNSGTSKDEVMYGFFNAQEFTNLANSFGVTPIRDEDQLNAYGTTGIDGFVNRFYTLVLNRTPDENGFNDWTTQLANGTKAGGDIAKGFFTSQEYLNRGLDNSTFLDICYRAFFDREADYGGKLGWLNLLEKGDNKVDILDGFIGSQEFINLADRFGIEPGRSGAKADASIALKLKATYELPYIYSYYRNNILVDGDSIILAGGEKGQVPGGTSSDGHIAFSNKVIKINLVTGEKKELEMNAHTGDPYASPATNGRGNTAKIHRIGKDKYLITGGFQYVVNMEIADFNTMTVKSIIPDVQITDTQYGGLNTTPYFANLQGMEMAEDGNIYFFGFYNGLYGLPQILKFDVLTEEISLHTSELGMPRYNVVAVRLADGRILLIGGWDGSAEVTPGSATRRVEIFNPDDGSIIRVADTLSPFNINFTQFLTRGEDYICIWDKQYTISTNSWQEGCDKDYFSDIENILSEYILPDDYKYLDGDNNFIKKLSNGDIVFFENAITGNTFSDEISAYSIEKNTMIKVYTPR